MQASSGLKSGTILSFDATVSKGTFPEENYVSIPIEDKNVTGFISNKFIGPKNTVVGVVVDMPSKTQVAVFFSGEVSIDSSNPVVISLKWLLNNTKVVK